MNAPSFERVRIPTDLTLFGRTSKEREVRNKEKPWYFGPTGPTDPFTQNKENRGTGRFDRDGVRFRRPPLSNRLRSRTSKTRLKQRNPLKVVTGSERNLVW